MPDENKAFEEKIRQIVRDELYAMMRTEFKVTIEEEVHRQMEIIADEKKITKEMKQEKIKKEYIRKEILEWLAIVRDTLVLYLDSDYFNIARPTIKLADGRTLGMGFAAHVSGDPGDFKKMGFQGYSDFYNHPMNIRNEFLKAAYQQFEELVPEDVTNLNADQLNTLQNKIQTVFRALVIKLDNENPKSK